MEDSQELEKFDSLVEEYGKEYVDFLKQISLKTKLTYEQICLRLPSSEIVKRDEDYIDRVPITRVLTGVAQPASYVLSYYCIMGDCPEDYPEQPSYYISRAEGFYPAPFTKQEFLDSIKKESTKIFEKK